MTLVSWHRSKFFVPPEVYVEVRESLLRGIAPWGDLIRIQESDPAHCKSKETHSDNFFQKFNLFEKCYHPESEKSKKEPPDWLAALDELRSFQKNGFKVCLYEDEAFPARLRQLRYPPWALSYHGSLATLDQPSLAVVGAREISTLTQVWVETELQDFIEKSRVVTISGGARGVDQAVHWQSLKLGLPTVMVLPSGLQKVYPKNMHTWIEKISRAGGLSISEFPPNLEMRKWHFFLRNRLIAGLADKTLIAQAQKKSGTWSTAQWAIEEGREILALACFPGATAFSGNIELIKSGAPPIFDHQDLLFHFSQTKNDPLSTDIEDLHRFECSGEKETLSMDI